MSKIGKINILIPEKVKVAMAGNNINIEGPLGKKINVKIDEKKILLNLNVNISSNFIDLEFPKIANSIEVNLLENKDNFTEAEWKNLYKLSEDTFVEESDSLKEGAAGAGLTDND